MGLSDIVSRVVEVIGAAAIVLRRQDGSALEPAVGVQAGDPARQGSGHPDAQNADRQGMDPRADADGGPRAQGQCLCGQSQASPLDPRPAEWRRACRRGAYRGAADHEPLRLRHVQHDETGRRCRGQPQPHHAFARRGRRRRRRGPEHVPRRAEPAVRDGAPGRHVLRRQYRRRGCVSLCGGRDPHRGAGAQADRFQDRRRALDAEPLAEPRRSEALRRSRLARAISQRTAWPSKRAAPPFTRSILQAAGAASSPAACAIPWAWRGSRGPARSGRWSTSATAWATRRLPTISPRFATEASTAGPIAIGGRRWTTACLKIRKPSQRR